MNIWLLTLLLFLFGLPLIVLRGKPVRGWALLKRFLLLVALGYAVLNIGLYAHRTIEWQRFEACQSQFPDDSIQYHAECPTPTIADGASNVFYLYLGWLPAGIYVGIWMLVGCGIRRIRKSQDTAS